MNIKRMGTFTLIALLALQLIALPAAFANENTAIDESTTADNRTGDTPSPRTTNTDGTITVVETYPATEEAPTLPTIINQDGKTYMLEDTTTTADETYERPTQTFTYSFSSEVPLEGINNLGAYFPATYTVDEGEYQGEIGLDPTTPFTVVERYEAFRRQVDRTTSLGNLPDNDVSRLPFTQTFEVSSAAAPGATTQATLQLLDVSYTIAGTDHLGLPNNYTAHLTYRGQEEYLVLHHYDVTAHYTGELTSSADQMAMAGLYAPTPARTSAITAPETPLTGSPENPLVPLAVTSAVVAVFLATPIFLFFLLSNARLIRISSEETASGARKERAQLVCRRRLVLSGGVAEFKIPPQTDIFDGAIYSLYIKPHFAQRDGSIEITWQGKVVAAMPLAEHISIDFKDLLIASVETALKETNILD